MHHRIESRIVEKARALGYDIRSQQVGIKHTNNVRAQCVLFDPHNPGAVFAEARDMWGLLKLLWRVPPIAGRIPRPSVEVVVREAAAQRGYRVVVQPGNANQQVGFMDKQGHVVAGAPFWSHALAVVLQLPLIASAQPAPTQMPTPQNLPPHRPFRDVSRAAENVRRAELEAMDPEERADLEREEQHKGPCRFCGGAGCIQCDPPTLLY